MSDYVTPDALRDYIGSDTTNNSATVSSVCTVASRFVDHLCDRYFYQDSSVTARYYAPDDWYTACTDDISTTTGLVVATDDAYDGTYSTTWTITTDFVLEPRNPVAGITHPYSEIVATGTKVFPQAWAGRPKPLKVTAKFGWASTPDEITHATKIAAAWLFKMKDAPDGFIGLDGWGPRFYKDNPAVRMLLAPFMQSQITVA